MITKAEIQLVKSLDDKRSRTETGLFAAEGRKLVGEIARSPLKVERIYVSTDEALAAFPEALRISPRDMERISHLKTPADTLATVRIPESRFDPAECSRSLVLALDGVQNPGNVGTIIRLADWFGIKEIVCSPDCADCFNPKVVQATMGAILRVRVHYLPLAGVLAEARRHGAEVYGTFLEGENLYAANLGGTGVIVMGSEGRGISDETAQQVSHKLLIPPYPADRRSSESLNVAVATAVICAEFRRAASMKQ